MDDKLVQKLKKWRTETAKLEQIAPFRVFSNKVLEDIARLKPATREKLLTIKGIKERKFGKYGKDILDLVNGNQKNIEAKKPYTVSGYLNLLNSQLREQKARVRGEISSLDIRENYLFFSLKDKEDDSILNCFMWRGNYELCGISFEEGIEIIVEGFSEVYKPNGRLSFRVTIAELVGEGTLKKAYDQLKKRLEKEGLFAVERKQPIPEFPQKIGLITSKSGEVIHDFLNNLGKYGYHIKFFNSRVEGQAAVRDLLSAIDYFNDIDIDVLVIIRGGGGLESLQAFNNEVLVRKIADFNIPVICGIGHERDVSLVSLAADLMVSTPTAVTVVLNKSWEKTLGDIQIFKRDIIYKYQKALADKKYQIEIMSRQLRQKSDFIFRRFELVKHQLSNKLAGLGYVLRNSKKMLDYSLEALLVNFRKNLDWLNDYLNKSEKRIRIADPMRQLELGYSIVLVKGAVVRSVRQVKRGEEVDIQVSDGKIKSQVNDIINKQS
jgi:exodeoxyribonuclease VII large subunit